MSEIFLINKDWKGTCILENNMIFRKDFENEYGTFNINQNKLTINWENWDCENYYFYNNSEHFYLESIFFKNYENNYIIDNEKICYIILNILDNNYIDIENKNELLSFQYVDNFLILNNDKKFKKINNFYFNINDFDQNFFELNICNNLINEIFIFNRKNKNFYSTIDMNNNGIYETIDNSILMKWFNGNKKKFYANKYFSNTKYQINLIKPKKIIINDKILFSNITLCKNKIILTSMHYDDNPWNYYKIDFLINNLKIINKTIIINDNYFEPSTIITLELEKEINCLTIKIIYDNNNFEIFLDQLKIENNKLSLMTLFKDDFQLLKRFLKYYSNLGVEIFFLYFNGKIDNNFINHIIKINEFNLKIYLVEWDYKYWNKEKQHKAQTMAISDSLHILKNFSKYTIYNDLDEYFLLSNFKNLNDLIDSEKDIDVFIFKNRFCKMGNDKIKYSEFDNLFDFNNIIEGNYWIEGREKNIIKLENINKMGIHKIYDENKNKLVVDQFYHIINFKEKYRDELMTDFIT